MDELTIIDRFFRPLASGVAGAFELTDDAASLNPPAGQDFVVTADMVVAGVHFLPDDPPQAVAHKALAVNLSDLAAKGADPVVYLLSLAITDAVDEAWLSAFASGLEALQEASGCCLAGGDTVRARHEIAIAITAIGQVPEGRMIRRSTARSGDRLLVSGTVGDAALGLRLAEHRCSPADWGLDARQAETLIDRYRRPRPRTVLAPVLRDHAHAAIDISDGLALDLDRLCRSSGVTARIDAGAVPLSPEARTPLKARPDLLETVITGGDDYEVLAAVPPESVAAFVRAAADIGMTATDIGAVQEGRGAARIVGPDGAALNLPVRGFLHRGEQGQTADRVDESEQ